MIKNFTNTIEVLVIDKRYEFFGDPSTPPHMLEIAHYAMTNVYTAAVPGSYTLDITMAPGSDLAVLDLKLKS